MGEMAGLWGYNAEQHEEHLEQRLLMTTLELENVKAESMEENKKNKEYIKQIIHLLKSAIQERDEARNQLQKLLNNFSTIQVESPLVKQNSSLTESSNSFSESLFDAVSSSEFSNNIDSGMLVIDNLVKGRVLPENGKFLQAVLESGPLLQTLLVAGPLPRWRNPPRLETFQIPPVSSIKGCDAEALVRKPESNVGQFGYGKIMSCGSNVGHLGYGTSCVSNNASLLYSGISGNGSIHLAKRQRFC